MRLHASIVLSAALALGVPSCRLSGQNGPLQEPSARVVPLPPRVQNPRLFSLGDNTAVAYISSKRVVSSSWRLYSYEITVEKIGQASGALSLTAVARLSLPPMGRHWPEFAVQNGARAVLVAFQKPTEVLTVCLGRAILSAPGRAVTLDELARIAGPECLSAPRGFSFLQNQASPERDGLCGTDADGRLWLCTAGVGTARERIWDLSKPLPGYSRFHPRGLFMKPQTIALFFVDRGRAGGVRMVIVQEHMPGIWRKSSEVVVHAGDATALAVCVHGDELCLLSSRPCDTGQELRLFASSDRGKTWKLRRTVGLKLKGKLCDLVLLDSSSRAAGVVMSDSVAGEARHILFAVRLDSSQSGRGGAPAHDDN